MARDAHKFALVASRMSILIEIFPISANVSVIQHSQDYDCSATRPEMTEYIAAHRNL